MTPWAVRVSVRAYPCLVPSSIVVSNSSAPASPKRVPSRGPPCASALSTGSVDVIPHKVGAGLQGHGRYTLPQRPPYLQSGPYKFGGISATFPEQSDTVSGVWPSPRQEVGMLDRVARLAPFSGVVFAALSVTGMATAQPPPGVK